MRATIARTTGQAISFTLIGPALICLAPSPPELAHPSLPLVTKMIQEREDTCGHLKGAQEPPSFHRLGVSYPSLLGSEKNPRMRQYVLAAMATMNGEFIIASKCDNLQEASLNISATSATFLAI